LFGKTETFRRLVRIRVPVSMEDAARGRVNLKVTSQGCADAGVCYLPLEQTVRVPYIGSIPSLIPSYPSSDPPHLQRIAASLSNVSGKRFTRLMSNAACALGFARPCSQFSSVRTFVRR